MLHGLTISDNVYLDPCLKELLSKFKFHIHGFSCGVGKMIVCAIQHTLHEGVQYKKTLGVLQVRKKDQVSRNICFLWHFCENIM